MSTFLLEAALRGICGFVHFKLDLLGCYQLTTGILWGAQPDTLGGKSFSHTPLALTELSGLERLNMSDNALLQLSKECLGSLISLPRLSTLELRKGLLNSTVWSVAFIIEISDISKELLSLLISP